MFGLFSGVERQAAEVEQKATTGFYIIIALLVLIVWKVW